MSRFNYQDAYIYHVRVRAGLFAYGIPYDEAESLMKFDDIMEEIRENGIDDVVEPALLAFAITAGDNLHMIMNRFGLTSI